MNIISRAQRKLSKMVNFIDALNTKSAQIERPPLIPVGTYRAAVTDIPEITKVSDGKWDVVNFKMRLIEPTDDVNTDDLQAYGNLGPQSVVTQRFMFSAEDEAGMKRTLYNMKRFLLDHLRIEGNDDTTVKELLNNSKGAQCLVFIGWRPDKNDPELIYNEIKKTAPLE